MFLFLCKALILVDQLHKLRLRPCPLALDISQRTKDCQVEIDCRHLQCFPVAARCHLILHGISRIDLGEAAY